MSRNRIDWHSYFIDLMRNCLSPLGLRVDDRVKLGKMPLEADLVIITLGQKQGWKQHPLWKYLTHINVVEFKSISKTLRLGDFEKLLAYTLLYRIKHKIRYDRHVSAWLVISHISSLLKRALMYYGIELKPVLPGFWQAQLLFPLVVAEYDHLPVELPYTELKLFIKSGKGIQEILQLVLQSGEEVKIEHVIETAQEIEIHPKDLEVLLKMKGKTAAHQSLEKTMLELTREYREKEKKEAEKKKQVEIAQQMKAKEFDLNTIAELTGLSVEAIKKL